MSLLESFEGPSPTGGPQSIDAAIEALAARLAAIEAKVSSPSIMSTVVGTGFDELVIGTTAGLTAYGAGAYGSGPYGGGAPGSGIIVIGPGVSPPTGLVLTSGSFFDEIFLDVAWTAPADGKAVEYEIEVARKTGTTFELQQIFRTAATNIRISPVLPLTTYGVRIFSLNRLSQRSAALPVTGFTEVVTSVDATIPSAVMGLGAGAGLRSVTITWDDVADPDVRRGAGLYEVSIATDSLFTVNVQTKRVSGEITAFTNLTPETTYYYRIAAIDASGNQGAYSATGSVTTSQAGTNDLADGIITSDHIITAGLDAAVIKFGTMSGDRITVNTLDANRIVTSSITSADITLAGGSFRAGSPPTTGLLINSQGISLYASSVRTVFLDAVTGNGAFTGAVTGSTITGSTIVGGTITGATFKTSGTAHAERIEILTAPETIDGLTSNYIKMYSPVPSTGLDPYRPGRIFSDILGGDTAQLNLRPPYPASGSAQVVLSLGTTGGASWSSFFGESNDGPSLQMSNTAGAKAVTFFDADTFTILGDVDITGDVVVANLGADLYTGPTGSGRPKFASGTGEVLELYWNQGTSQFQFVKDNVVQKTFVIDHPSDPERYLVHATVEGPENAVFYRGRARLRGRTARVELPPYFESLTATEGRTVHLTPIDRHVALAAGEVEGGGFSVTAYGDYEGTEFYWRVEAVRKDVPALSVEPRRSAVALFGDGPYRYLKEIV